MWSPKTHPKNFSPGWRPVFVPRGLCSTCLHRAAPQAGAARRDAVPSPGPGHRAGGCQGCGKAPRSPGAGCAVPPASPGASPAVPRSEPGTGTAATALPAGRQGQRGEARRPQRPLVPGEGWSGDGRGEEGTAGPRRRPGLAPVLTAFPALPAAATATGDAARSARGAWRALRAPGEGPRAKLCERLPQQRGLRGGSGAAGAAQAPPGCPGRLRHVEARSCRPAQRSAAGGHRGAALVPANAQGGFCLPRHPAHLPQLPRALTALPWGLERRAAGVPQRAAAPHGHPAARLGVGQPCEWGAGEFPPGWDRRFFMAAPWQITWQLSCTPGNCLTAMFCDTSDKDIFVTASPARLGSLMVRSARGQREVCWKRQRCHGFGSEFAALGWLCGPCEAAVDRKAAPQARVPGPGTLNSSAVENEKCGQWSLGQVREPQCEILSAVTVSQPSENTTIKKTHLDCLWCWMND